MSYIFFISDFIIRALNFWKVTLKGTDRYDLDMFSGEGESNMEITDSELFPLLSLL